MAHGTRILEKKNEIYGGNQFLNLKSIFSHLKMGYFLVGLIWQI